MKSFPIFGRGKSRVFFKELNKITRRLKTAVQADFNDTSTVGLKHFN